MQTIFTALVYRFADYVDDEFNFFSFLIFSPNQSCLDFCSKKFVFVYYKNNIEIWLFINKSTIMIRLLKYIHFCSNDFEGIDLDISSLLYL